MRNFSFLLQGIVRIMTHSMVPKQPELIQKDCTIIAILHTVSSDPRIPTDIPPPILSNLSLFILFWGQVMGHNKLWGEYQ